jgi:hypothetical protein
MAHIQDIKRVEGQVRRQARPVCQKSQENGLKELWRCKRQNAEEVGRKSKESAASAMISSYTNRPKR